MYGKIGITKKVASTDTTLCCFHNKNGGEYFAMIALVHIDERNKAVVSKECK